MDLERILKNVVSSGKDQELEEKWARTRSLFNVISNEVFGCNHHLALIKLNQGLMPGYEKKKLSEIASIYNRELIKRGLEPNYIPNAVQRHIACARKAFGLESLMVKHDRSGKVEPVKKKKRCMWCKEWFTKSIYGNLCDNCLAMPEYMENNNGTTASMPTVR